ncbi:hypothetical protein SAMN05421678_102378 [Actinopolymorpha cephalotaxi]|uniref:DUF4190 domain-containing protein n=1 Tax=Actinopolymorpha cephalotaxi TaxID=504797 RepID=A0A1I2LZJ8_9ACTN|nr:hypothetical protein [Actinopolymorpha cephalotaxi]NYH81515.1 hypothetical protein [Actinopolymorpha cephalotaxi]SFF84614.1 hypothetical protein SAMN05421678_102378 [Actinopolymorpha cephalotaxi]
MTAADPRDPRDPGDPSDPGAPRDSGDPRDAEQSRDSGEPRDPRDLYDPGEATPARPQRPPRNRSGWIGLALAGVAFLASLLVAWTGAVLLAALGLALSVTGLVRAYRGRATNGKAAAGGLVLAILTVALGFFWSHQAQPCLPYTQDKMKFSQCYQDHTGLL